jgi:lipoprotein-releasing system ATP-binding protein
MIEVKNITRSFSNIQVLKGINLIINKGEVVSIVGSSGAGKTTLLQIIGTLLKPDGGEVTINCQNPLMLKDDKLATFRNQNIGFVFQFHHLLPEFTAIENVCIPAFIARQPKKETEKRALELLQFLNLGHRLHHKPNEMSGGEQQRVAVARALINNPSVLLADEPSGNLDWKNKTELHQLFFQLRDTFGKTIVIVTHDKELSEMSDRKIVMQDGSVVSSAGIF